MATGQSTMEQAVRQDGVRGDVAHSRMTYEEFLTAADEDRPAEWIRGEVIYMSPASHLHQRIAAFLAAILQHYAQARGLGEVLAAPFQMKTGEELPGREPDVMFVATERLDCVRDTYLQGPADLAVEIISGESRSRDRGEKYYEYEAGGVREYWLIDPIRQQAEFYVLDEKGIYQLHRPDAEGKFRSVVFEGLWLEVAWLWQSPLPPLMDVLRAWELV